MSPAPLARRRPATRAAAALVLVALLSPGPARAHALLVQSTPADGATLAATPALAVLRFNSRLEKRLSRVALVGPDGAERPLDAGAGDAPDRLTVRLPPLAPGAYRIAYQVLAVDGHATPGLIRFTIAPPP